MTKRSRCLRSRKKKSSRSRNRKRSRKSRSLSINRVFPVAWAIFGYGTSVWAAPGIFPQNSLVSPREWPLLPRDLFIAVASSTLALLFGYLIRKRMVSANGSPVWVRPDSPGPQLNELAGQLNAELENRKRAESALEATEAKFRILTESQMIGVALADFGGALREVNDAFLHLIGYSREEFDAAKLRWDAITPPEYRAIDAQHVQETREKGKCSAYEKEYLHKDGHRVPILVGATRIARTELCLAYIVDLSERNLAARKLQLSEQRLSAANAILGESERHYRELADAMPQIVWTAQPSGQVDSFNERWFEYTGAKGGPIAADSWQPWIHPEDLAKYRSLWVACVASGDPFQFEYRLRHRSGHYCWHLGRAIAVRDEQGAVARWYGTATDIDTQKRDRDKLKAGTEELARSNAELELFAYIASHDLKEPLHMISSYVQLLRKRYGVQLGPEAHEYIEFAIEGATRMQALIQDLLSYSGIGRETLVRAEIDFTQLVEEARQQLSLAVRESGATIACSPLPRLSVHPAQFTQLFQNLISNALKFRASAPPRIEIGAREQDGEWLFWVQDNGIGIDPEYRQKIFVLFKRLHSRAEYAGTGIGLAICKKVIEQRGGRIWVESEPGQGSTFYFTVPVEPPEKS